MHRIARSNISELARRVVAWPLGQHKARLTTCNFELSRNNRVGEGHSQRETTRAERGETKVRDIFEMPRVKKSIKFTNTLKSRGKTLPRMYNKTLGWAETVGRNNGLLKKELHFIGKNNIKGEKFEVYYCKTNDEDNKATLWQVF